MYNAIIYGKESERVSPPIAMSQNGYLGFGPEPRDQFTFWGNRFSLISNF